MLYINFMSAGLIEMAAYGAQEILSSKSNDKSGQNWHKPVFRPLEISQSIHQIENCLLKKIYWNSVKTVEVCGILARGCSDSSLPSFTARVLPEQTQAQMSLVLNSIKHLKKKTNPLQTLPENTRWNSFYVVSITLISKLDKDIPRKLDQFHF